MISTLWTSDWPVTGQLSEFSLRLAEFVEFSLVNFGKARILSSFCNKRNVFLWFLILHWCDSNLLTKKKANKKVWIAPTCCVYPCLDTSKLESQKSEILWHQVLVISAGDPCWKMQTTMWVMWAFIQRSTRHESFPSKDQSWPVYITWPTSPLDCQVW